MYGARSLDEEKCIQELDTAESLAELKMILMNISYDDVSGDILFKDKYQVLLLENMLPWQKPLGELFHIAVAVCGAKPRKFSDSEAVCDVFLSEDKAPLPLKFDFLAHRSSEKSRTCSILQRINEKYILYPLSQNIGRKILNMSNSFETDDTKKWPIIAICYGRDHKSVVLLGSSKRNKNLRLMVLGKGSISKQEQLPRLSNLKEDHLEGFPPSFSMIETSVYTHYDFLRYDSKKAILKPVDDAKLIMECWWSNASSLLEPLTADCICFAKMKAVGGNPTTGAYSLYKELKLIEALLQSLDTGMLLWPGAGYDGYTVKHVKDFMNREKINLSKRDKSSSAITDLEYFDKIVLRQRSNLDFTEKLWLILKDCATTEELVEAFALVYNALEEFFAPPFVSQKNKSTIATAIKSMMETKIVCPDLEHGVAIKLLLEIGVEKLRRDYVSIFFGLELIPHECISYFLHPNLLSQEAVMCLKKLHTILELSIVCVTRLILSKELLGEFVRNTLKHYTTVPDIDLQHEFTFQIPAIKARQVLNKMRPTVWEVSFISSVNDFMKQSIHRYTTTPVNHHINAPTDYHPKLMLKTASYHYFTATLIQDGMALDEE